MRVLHQPPASSISIHALREEGDQAGADPRPCAFDISIHALREEGDANSWDTLRLVTISIHALREEGDRTVCGSELAV